MITVFGLLGQPSVELRIAAATADHVVGGRRHLDALEVPEERRIVLGALRPAVEKIATLPDDAQVVVLASGDPVYFGVVRALRRTGLHPEVVSAPSSIATAFAAVGVPWDDAVVVSAHGRPLAPAANLARAHAKVAVSTSAENGIRELAAALSDLDRTWVLAERLGEDDQRVRVLDNAAARALEPLEPNVVLILDRPVNAADPDWAGDLSGPTRPARPEVSAAAAVAFARLLPGPGELLRAGGALAGEVSDLARWAGAAVVSDAGAADLIGPDVILTDSPDTITGTPRTVVLSGPTPDVLPLGYRWSSEQIAGHQLTTGVPA